MKKIIPLVLSAALLSSAVACSKPNTETKNVSNPANTGISENTKPNTPLSLPAGTSFETVLQQELSTGKNRNDETFNLQVKNSVKGSKVELKDSQIQGHLEDVVKAAKGKKASFHLVFDELVLKDGSTYPIDASLVNTQVETKTKGKFLQNAGIILGGVAAGHFAGKKANIKHGGLAGGAAASAYVLSSPGGEVVLKKGTKVQLKLKSALATTP
ncbi:hypothetical protein [Calothrix sp. PCC 7507]|uniref:hypothetical protein n=1 Tax=Calothrix sp. PCC 7507 TaxID=99598 RepID=UPI00029ECA54|nr:hypothetical protein [Calothrix sp. PCC 7507]AFY35003.1 hypothetical protein Cal7507_4640 [Calothrix sp. PCC 7507]